MSNSEAPQPQAANRTRREFVRKVGKLFFAAVIADLTLPTFSAPPDGCGAPLAVDSTCSATSNDGNCGNPTAPSGAYDKDESCKAHNPDENCNMGAPSLGRTPDKDESCQGYNKDESCGATINNNPLTETDASCNATGNNVDMNCGGGKTVDKDEMCGPTDSDQSCSGSNPDASCTAMGDQNCTAATVDNTCGALPTMSPDEKCVANGPPDAHCTSTNTKDESCASSRTTDQGCWAAIDADQNCGTPMPPSGFTDFDESCGHKITVTGEVDEACGTGTPGQSDANCGTHLVGGPDTDQGCDQPNGPGGVPDPDNTSPL